MTADAHKPQPSASGLAAAKAFVSELIAGTQSDAVFDAAAIVARHPELELYKSAAIDLAYEEYCRKRQAGEACAPHEFAQRFPEIQQSLLRVLEVHQWIERESASLAGWPKAGDEFLGCRLIAEIGVGAFSRVYLASETAIGEREIIVKICDDAGIEADRLGRLSGHPNIIPVHTVARDPFTGLSAIVMPFLGTETLLDTLDAVFRGSASAETPAVSGAARTNRVRPPSSPCQPAGTPISADDPPGMRFPAQSSFQRHIERVADWGAQLCDALAFAHERGIFHSDIKPSNVLLTRDGRPMLLDFNLSVRSNTEPRRMGGTLPYMAPEQLALVAAESGAGEASIDATTDLYSLGVMLFQLLTGTLPFPPPADAPTRSAAAADMRKRQQAGLHLPAGLERNLGPEIVKILRSCLSLEKGDRPASAAQLAREFRAYLSPAQRRRRWLFVHRWSLAAACLVLVSLLTAGVLVYASQPEAHIREFRQGVAAFERADWTAATARLSRAIELSRDFPQALLARGWSFMQAAEDPELDPGLRKDLHRRAYEDFTRAVELSGTPAAKASAAYSQCFEDPQFGLAARQFESALADGLNCAALWNNLGYCQQRLQDQEIAAASFAEALAIAPQLLEAHYNFAFVELRRSYLDRSEASAHAERSVRHIEKARSGALFSADLEFGAARIYASALKLGDPAQHDLYRERFLACYRSAIDLGLAPGQAESDSNIRQALQSTPVILPVSQQTAAASRQPARPAGLADILPDVRAYFLSTP